MPERLGLPEGLNPIWLEGIVTQEYERDTLPLLFASDEVFYEYYDALVREDPDNEAAIERIRATNRQARQERAEGFWQECLANLARCVHLRRVCYDDNDYQYTAAQLHHVLSIYSFASFFLSEAKSAQPNLRQGLLARAFELFTKAGETAADVQNAHHRRFLRAVVANNLANYFHLRGKHKAAAQQVAKARQLWGSARVPRGKAYFVVREHSALCYNESWDDAVKGLKGCVSSMPAPNENGDERGQKPKGTEEDSGNAPVRFEIQVAANPMPMADAVQIVAAHNLSVSCVGQRKYKEAAEWCQRAMDAASRSVAHLAGSHPWVKAIKSCQTLCAKMSFTQHFTKYKMRPLDMHVPEFVKMQRIIQETRTMPIFNDLVQLHRQQRAQAHEAKLQQEEAKKRYAEELRRKAEANLATRGAAAIFRGHTQWSPQRRSPGASPPPIRKKPISVLRMYLRQTSYKQFVEEYNQQSGDDNKAVAHRRAPNSARAPHPPGGRPERRPPRSAGPASARPLHSTAKPPPQSPESAHETIAHGAEAEMEGHA
eukprot:Hpha_TRINITY_DN8701_c0_g1::TRINITY_DN8701_c0_g1_i1::g.45358::m.45358